MNAVIHVFIYRIEKIKERREESALSKLYNLTIFIFIYNYE
jgi:hypothetical protein